MRNKDMITFTLDKEIILKLKGYSDTQHISASSFVNAQLIKFFSENKDIKRKRK